ncbi:aspartate/glutamate racemase family protein [Pantoea sp. B65]|uniref:aspartate/glutamate racemase family protein n=1 Tax=Pantoea sp. B65 TaxID=2813359 RepID=UPI0039B411ED
MSKRFLLGILGGMGPLATVDLMYKLLAATPADSDQQQMPMVVWNVPQVADRQQALAGGGRSPLPQLLQGIARLNQAGASHIVIACNTAHHWFAALSAASAAPILHIADASLAALLQRDVPPRRAGVIATQGTLDGGWFQQRLQQRNIAAVLPTPQELQQLFVPGCYAVKRGEMALAAQLLTEAGLALKARGAELLILACTEVPVALQSIRSPLLQDAIDPTDALARQCAAIWQQQRHAEAG